MWPGLSNIDVYFFIYSMQSLQQSHIFLYHKPIKQSIFFAWFIWFRKVLSIGSISFKSYSKLPTHMLPLNSLDLKQVTIMRNLCTWDTKMSLNHSSIYHHKQEHVLGVNSLYLYHKAYSLLVFYYGILLLIVRYLWNINHFTKSCLYRIIF